VYAGETKGAGGKAIIRINRENYLRAIESDSVFLLTFSPSSHDDHKYVQSVRVVAS